MNEHEKSQLQLHCELMNIGGRLRAISEWVAAEREALESLAASLDPISPPPPHDNERK